MIALAWLLACGAPPEERPLEEPSEAELTPFERSLVDPVLAAVRAGVVPWNDEAVGLCEGTLTCEAYLGSDPGELPEGDYVVRAELRVPPVGAPGTWTVVFESQCTTEGSAPVSYRRTYEVVAPGADRPFRIGALRRITSPAASGAPESCTWRLTAPHPDGDGVYTGAWSTP